MNKIDKSLNESVFNQIKAIFVKKINSNEWKYGSKLPSREDIATRLNINVSVINMVIKSLEYEGYVKSVVGKGIYVSDKKINQNITSSISMDASLIQNNSEIKDLILDYQITQLPDDVVWKTRIKEKSEVLYIEILKSVNGNCFAIEKNYVVLEFCKELQSVALKDIIFTELLRKLHIVSDAQYKTYEPVNVDESDAEKLDCNINDAAMKTSTELYLCSHTISYTESIIRGNMFRFFCMIEGRNHIMKSSSVLLTRIDNRLVHGQVGVTWTKTIGANLIVVADDLVAKDELQQSLMSVTAKSSGVGIRFFSLQHTADIIERASAKQKIFIVVRSPKEARKLVELGVDLQKVNVGNMHFSQGKVALTKKIYVDDQDLEDLKFIAKTGIEVYCQDVPGDSIEIIK